MIEKIFIFGQGVSLYYTFWLIGAVTVLAVGYFTGKKCGFDFAKSILYIVCAIILGYLLLWATSWVFGGGEYSGLNFVRIVTFLPVPVWLLTKLFKDDFGAVTDFIAPLVAIFHGVTHIGCIFPGCCHGYPAQWGIYSNNAGTICFPNQPLEAVSSIIIGILLLCMLIKGQQRKKLYAWYLVLFGSTRFCWEFLRDNEKIWFGISELAFHALTACLLGIIALFALKHFTKESFEYEKN